MTRKRQDTTTLQVWPGGKSYTFRGDPDGPENQRSLRDGSGAKRRGNRCIHCGFEIAWALGDTREGGRDWKWRTRALAETADATFCTNGVLTREHLPTEAEFPNPWRKGTPEEWRAIRIEVRAELYGNRDILGCDSSLVDDLIKSANGGERYVKDLADGFSYEEIRNLYKDPSDWGAIECLDYIRDQGIKYDEPAETAEVDLDEVRELCRDHAQENPAEVYEWWRVSSWLCDQLHAIGEVTIDNGYGHWWGRTCTGQQWIMDGTLQQVAAQYERSE